jgi:homoserine dehydrogenase
VTTVESQGKVVRIGVLGCGNVGAAFVRLVEQQGATIQLRTGIRLEVVSVAVRNMSRDRDVQLPEGLLTRDAHAVVADPSIDLIVEVIGGIEPARELIAAALAAGKPVITANKELLANVGGELYAAADAAGVDLLFEAAVAGGIPVIRALRESLRGEPVSRVMGIINGTTNFILTKMSEEGADYSAALSEAQRLGFAERDPTADVEGFDAGAKAAILASIAFGAKVVAGDVYHEGISRVTAADIAVAKRLGYVIKLLGIAERDRETGEIAVRVHPAMVPNTHPLASVRESYNAVFIEGDAVGSLMFYGRGAGGNPTASAVLGDVIDAAVNLVKGTHGSIGSFAKATIRPIDETSSEYLLSMEVADKPGVLHAVTGAFANNGVSIRARRHRCRCAFGLYYSRSQRVRSSSNSSSIARHGCREASWRFVARYRCLRSTRKHGDEHALYLNSRAGSRTWFC